MASFRLRRHGLTPAETLELSEAERMVLARLSAPATERELLLRTGISVEALRTVVTRLEALGAVERVDAGAGRDDTGRTADGLAEGTRVSSEEAPPGERGTSPPDGESGANLPDGVQPWSGGDLPVGVVSAVPATHPEGGDPAAVYAADLASLSVDARAARAKSARGIHLLALCHDPDPRVIATLIENDSFALDAARRVARHHRNARGLEILARRLELLRDPQTQRLLLRNPQLPDSVLTRLVGMRPLRDLFKLSGDRDVPERTRPRIRSELRKRFTTAQPEERAELIVRTEGRVLLLLTGCTFDGNTTKILCSRSFTSMLLIQNLARFSATPPPLLAKLVKQPVVRRQPQLRALLLRHPNMPGELKRRT